MVRPTSFRCQVYPTVSRVLAPPIVEGLVKAGLSKNIGLSVKDGAFEGARMRVGRVKK